MISANVLSGDAHGSEDTMDAQEIRLKGFQPRRDKMKLSLTAPMV